MARNSVTICSVFFQPIHAVRNYRPFDNSGGYTSHFSMEACKQGEHKLLKIGNYFEHTYVGERKYMDTPVYCDGINGLGFDLVNEWAENALGADKGGPGIFCCAGDEPTAEELERAFARQTAWADHICLLAEIEWINGRKGNVSKLQREAAHWLGRAAEYEWVSDRGTVRVTFCPMCAQSIDGRAIVCPKCHNIVDFTRYQQYLESMEKLRARLGDEAKNLLPEKPIVPLPPPVVNPQQQKRTA